MAALSAWVAAFAVLVAVAAVGPALVEPGNRAAVAVAAGALEAALLAGPGVDDLVVRASATVVAVACVGVGVVAPTDRACDGPRPPDCSRAWPR